MTRNIDPSDFEPWLTRWGLEPDGAPIITHSSRLLPVLSAGTPAMLKAAMHPEEFAGSALMVWWAGQGAARVLEMEGDALLLERVVGERSLKAMVEAGRDDEATRIICGAAAALHADRDRPPPETLVPLPVWFRALAPGAGRHGGILPKALAQAQALLADPRDVRPLHGDIHHDNILDGGTRGWLAIDPKGLMGERAFDFANTLCNPWIKQARGPDRIRRQAGVIAAAAGLEPKRLMAWLLAYAGLSAAWTLDDGGAAEPALEIAAIAANALENG